MKKNTPIVSVFNILINPKIKGTAQKTILSNSLKIINWDDLIQFSEFHQLSAFILHRINALNGTQDIPQQYLKLLQQKAGRNTMRGLLMYKETIRLVNLLSQNTIPCLVLKGPVLGSFIYNVFGIRHSLADIDLLIKPQDIKKCITLLNAEGYVIDIQAIDYDFYHILFRKKSNIVEIHFNFDAFLKYPIEKVFQQHRRYKSVPVLSVQDTFGLLLTKYAHDHYFISLKNYVDLVFFIHKYSKYISVKKLPAKLQDVYKYFMHNSPPVLFPAAKQSLWKRLFLRMHIAFLHLWIEHDCYQALRILLKGIWDESFLAQLINYRKKRRKNKSAHIQSLLKKVLIQ
jgi:hypothetical protein